MESQITIPVPDIRKLIGRFRKSPTAERRKGLSNLIRILASNNLGLYPDESYENFIWQHNTHIWVYRCTRVIVNCGKRVEPRQYREYMSKGIRKREELPASHSAVKVLRDPNPVDTSSDIIEKLLTSLCLTGIWYLDYEDANNELWHLRSDRMTINPDPKTFIRDFTYSKHGGTTVFPRENIVWGKYYNPNNDYYGLSPLRAATNSVSGHLKAQSWNLNFFDNSAMPLGLLTTDYNFANDQDLLELIKKEWRELYGGYKKFGSTAVMGGGMKYQPITPTHTDMNFVKLLDRARDEICAAFGVTPIFTNTTEGMNYANAREHEKLTWHNTMIPIFILLQQAFNKFLNQRFAEKGEYIRTIFDLSQVEALREDVVKEAEASRIKIFSGQMLVNESREARGEPPLENGDVSLIPMSMIRLDQAGDVLGNKIPATGQTPPKSAIKCKNKILDTKEKQFSYWSKMVKNVEDNKRKLTRLLIAIFTDWQEEIIRNIDARKSIKADFSVESIMFDRAAAGEMLRRVGEPLMIDSLEEGGKRALATVGVETAFDVHDPRVEELLDRAVQRFAEEISGGHWARMKDSLQEGINAGETPVQLQERVRETMGHEINNAPTVARTEINPRYQEGNIEGMRQSSVVEKKEWLPAFTETSREDHIAAGGQPPVPLNGYFEVGPDYLEYPGDPSGTAENIINCLCDMMPVVVEE